MLFFSQKKKMVGGEIINTLLASSVDCNALVIHCQVMTLLWGDTR